MSDAIVIGAGPAGLMAAETLLTRGHSVRLIDAKPSFGRKFLMAGKSGLNLTKDQPLDVFIDHFQCSDLRPMLTEFGPDAVRLWAQDLGQEIFVGSSGRVFPTSMKASPLLRAWLARLQGLGLDTMTKWRWTGWNDKGDLSFDTADGPQDEAAKVTVLALGGASWARLGSDGLWAQILAKQNVPLAPFAPSNVGLNVAWSDHIARHAGAPIKNVMFKAGPLNNRGEAVVTRTGLEGGGLYSLTPAIRAGHGVTIDLFPDQSIDALRAKLSKPRGKQSLTTYLRKTLKAPPVGVALIQECARDVLDTPVALAKRLKSLTVPVKGLRPMDEAISTAGGVPFDAMTPALMLKARSGVFCAGEMLDWEAPTGGYLITACLATGRWAGNGAADYLAGMNLGGSAVP